MVNRRQEPKTRRGAPAASPKALEDQLISDAYKLAAQQLHDGTAAAQVITLFLKLGSSREKLEQYKLEKEGELLEIKKEAYAAMQRTEERYAEALRAMRSYQGEEPKELEGDYDRAG